MRFLLYSYNFSPEKTGIGKYNGEWAAWLVAQGHTVDVITSNPYYPEWKVHESYRDRRWRTEREGRLTVYRTPMYIPRKMSGANRILSDMSFAVTSLVSWIRCLFRPRYDVVIAVCPPMFSGFYTWLYSRLFKTLFVFHVQDLQVDAAAKLGMIKNRMLLKILDGMERFFLTEADLVSSISEGMKKNLINKGVSEANYLMLSNWVNLELMKPVPAEKQRFGWSEEQRIVLYSGNMGAKQGLEIIPQVADLLRNEDRILFVMCGEGPAKADLCAEAKRRDLKNMIFLPLQPLEELPYFFAAAEVHLIPQKRAAADLVLPSKLTGILACGGLAVVAAEKGTSLYAMINAENLGVTVEPENPEALAAAILDIMNNNYTLRRNRARAYAVNNLGQEAILRHFESAVRKKLEEKGWK